LGDITDDENEENVDENNIDSISKLNVIDEVLLDKSNQELQENFKKLTKKEGDLDQIFGKIADSKANLQSDRVKTVTNININKTMRIQQQNNSYSVRTPNFIKIQNKPYKSKSYDKAYEEELYGKAVGTIVRWRNKTDDHGNIIIDRDSQKPLVESNARLVKWKDGTYQLVVGDSIFNLKIIPTQNRLIYLL
jgi:hypothetical protein